MRGAAPGVHPAAVQHLGEEHVKFACVLVADDATPPARGVALPARRRVRWIDRRGRLQAELLALHAMPCRVADACAGHAKPIEGTIAGARAGRRPWPGAGGDEEAGEDNKGERRPAHRCQRSPRGWAAAGASWRCRGVAVWRRPAAWCLAALISSRGRGSKDCKKVLKMKFHPRTSTQRYLQPPFVEPMCVGGQLCAPQPRFSYATVWGAYDM
jgi:hypothetical protein